MTLYDASPVSVHDVHAGVSLLRLAVPGVRLVSAVSHSEETLCRELSGEHLQHYKVCYDIPNVRILKRISEL